MSHGMALLSLSATSQTRYMVLRLGAVASCQPLARQRRRTGRRSATVLQPCLICGMPTNGSRCSVHKLSKTNPNRPGTTARGYGYEWQKLSGMMRSRNPWCEICGARDRKLTVDHLVPQSMGGDHSPGNLRVLCTDCHLRYGATKRRPRS